MLYGSVENGWACPESSVTEILMSDTLETHITDDCYDCNADAVAAAIAAEAAGQPPPPASTLNCPSGYYMGKVCGTCVPCPKGFFCQGGPENNRFPCDIGNYADTTNAFDCKTCPLFSTSKRAADSIQKCECIGGYTGIASDVLGCQRCQDSYKLSVGTEPCTNCPPHSSTYVLAATTKTDCKCNAGVAS